MVFGNNINTIMISLVKLTVEEAKTDVGLLEKLTLTVAF